MVCLEMDFSPDNSQKLMTCGKRRMPHCRTDDDVYEGSIQRQRLGGEFSLGASITCLYSHCKLIDPEKSPAAKRPSDEESRVCDRNDIEQTIIRGVELMDLHSHSSPLKYCLSNSAGTENINSSKCDSYSLCRGDRIHAYSKENMSARKFKKVYFRTRPENLDRNLFLSQTNIDSSPLSQLNSSNHSMYACQLDSREKSWDPYSTHSDSLVHRENISSAGTPPDANSFASFEDLGSQTTDDVFVKLSDSGRKRDVTDEERDDRIVKWLCTVQNMTESHGLFNVRLS